MQKVEEVRKAEEEREWKWKEEEDQVVRDQALEEACKWQHLVSHQLLLLCWELISSRY